MYDLVIVIKSGFSDENITLKYFKMNVYMNWLNRYINLYSLISILSSKF